MGKLHVKGWGRKTNYLNGKVACQGLGGVTSSLAKSDPSISPKIDPRKDHSTLLLRTLSEGYPFLTDFSWMSQLAAFLE